MKYDYPEMEIIDIKQDVVVTSDLADMGEFNPGGNNGSNQNISGGGF